MSGCIFCNNFDFRTARAAKTSTGTALIEIAGGNTRFSSTETFNYCPVCGRKLKSETSRWISGMERYEQWIGYTVSKLLQTITIHPNAVPEDVQYDIRRYSLSNDGDIASVASGHRLIDILRDNPDLWDAIIKEVAYIENTFVLTVR